MDEFRRSLVNRAGQPNPGKPAPRPTSPQPPTPPVQPPQPPVVTPTVTLAAPQGEQPPHTPQPIEEVSQDDNTSKKRMSLKKRLIIGGSAALALIIIIFGSAVVWYQLQLSPVNAKSETKELITIESGSTPADIAKALKEKGLIRDEQAFLWYTRITRTQNYLQAGTYRLSTSESTPQIVDHLKNGTVDTFNLTFLPGATLMQNRKVLLDAGYTEQQVNDALNASYTSPLFDGKPASADLEGYIYGDTYKVGAGDDLKVVLQQVFDEFYSFVQKNDLVAKYKSHGLSLYEGVTLASIIQREAAGGDESQIAQVFYSRLAQGMPLGSDVTYQYIADKTGVPRDPNLDSPYNTRKYAGLPPGPISVPGKAALLAVATPANTDYLYFLNGDDNVTYFAKTLDEHEANIKNHCQIKCQAL